MKDADFELAKFHTNDSIYKEQLTKLKNFNPWRTFLKY